MSMPELEAVKGPGEYIIRGKSVDLTEAQAAEGVRQIEAHEGLMRELRASDNWLHRLLKSCVIMLDDGEVTKRAVEKQSRYNKEALSKEPK